MEPWEPALVYILRLAGNCIYVTWEPFGPVLGHLYLGTLAILGPYSIFICETWKPSLGNYLGTTWEPLPWNLGSLYGQTYQTLKPQLANPHVFGNLERTFIWESLPRNLDLGACPGTFTWKPVSRTFTYGALLGGLTWVPCGRLRQRGLYFSWLPLLGNLYPSWEPSSSTVTIPPQIFPTCAITFFPVSSPFLRSSSSFPPSSQNKPLKFPPLFPKPSRRNFAGTCAGTMGIFSLEPLPGINPKNTPYSNEAALTNAPN